LIADATPVAMVERVSELVTVYKAVSLPVLKVESKTLNPSWSPAVGLPPKRIVCGPFISSDK
jgi:hypothetical protein